MNNRDLRQLKKNYMDAPIPEELNFIVNKALMDSRAGGRNRRSKLKRAGIAAASIAAAAAVLIIGVNSSPAFAAALLKVPVVGSMVKVLTIREYKVDDNEYQADIKVPSIEGLDNKDLQDSLNEKYLDENKKLYEEFMADMKDLEENGGGHLGVSTDYVIKTDTDKIFSIGRYYVNNVGSSSTTFKYDTVDKENQILITLPSLFKDDKYVDMISENIKDQMIEQNKTDSSKFYWVEGIEQNGGTVLFEKISEEQNFYISTEGKLVISFDKYEVAPGYMGVVEFTIPTEILSDILISDDYIK